MEEGAMFDKVKLWNRWAFYFAIFAGVGGHGVASFQSATDDCGGKQWIVAVHLWFALMFFGGGAIYCIISYWLDLKLPTLGSPRERLSRKIFCYGTVAQVFTVFCVLPGIYTWLGGEPIVIAIMSALEITTLGTFMSTYITFLDEFKGMKFKVMVMHDDRHYSIHSRAASELMVKREKGGTKGGVV
jgi:hypothetical protein